MTRPQHFPRAVIVLWAAAAVACVVKMGFSTGGAIETILSDLAGLALLAGCGILVVYAKRVEVAEEDLLEWDDAIEVPRRAVRHRLG
jgi:hypothetical protein